MIVDSEVLIEVVMTASTLNPFLLITFLYLWMFPLLLPSPTTATLFAAGNTSSSVSVRATIEVAACATEVVETKAMGAKSPTIAIFHIVLFTTHSKQIPVIGGYPLR